MAASDKEPSGWFTLALNLGLFTLRDLTARRRLMFYLTISAMVQLALGLFILNQLSKSILIFVFYWSFCMLQVCLMMLLALYDMLTVKRDQQAEISRLRETILTNDSPNSNADDSEKSGKA